MKVSSNVKPAASAATGQSLSRLYMLLQLLGLFDMAPFKGSCTGSYKGT